MPDLRRLHLARLRWTLRVVWQDAVLGLHQRPLLGAYIPLAEQLAEQFRFMGTMKAVVQQKLGLYSTNSWD